MADKKGNPARRGGDDSGIQASDSIYSLPEEPRETLSAWLFAKRLKKYQRMKELEGGGGLQQMPGVARDFHSSSPGDGVKVHETADADVVAFEGDAGPEVAFAEREAPEVGDTELEDLGGIPAC